MKKVAFLVLALVMLGSFSACGPEESDVDFVEAKRLIVDTNATDKEIFVPTDTVMVFTHQSNISTGHIWKLISGGVFEIVDQEVIPQSDLIGASAKIFTYLAAKTNGQADIQFGYFGPSGELKNTKTYQATSQGTFNARLKKRAPERVAKAGEIAPHPSYLPTSFNWCDQDVCPPIHNGSSCGAAWAFVTTLPLEINIARSTGTITNLSEQYLISCNAEGWGCNGGWWAHAYHVDKKVEGETEAGAVLESDRPFTGQDDPCNPPNPKAYKAKSWGYVTEFGKIPTANQLKQAIYDHGPLSVAVYADSAFQKYAGGVFESSATGQVNHGVVLTGWSEPDVFILRNSWGSAWGENGTMRIKYGSNSIGHSAAYIIFDGPAPSPTPDPTPTPVPTPTPSPDPNPKSCKGYCGKKSPGGCWCDELCFKYNDCCDDIKIECKDIPPPTPTPTPTTTPTPSPDPNPKSCKGYCGKKSPGGCWCDDLCEKYNDCCSDKQKLCN